MSLKKTSTKHSQEKNSKNKKDTKSKGKIEKNKGTVKEVDEKLEAALRDYAEWRKTAPKVEATLPVTVSEITKRGFRVQTLDRDYRLTFKKYPWFADATEEELRDVVLKYECELHWDMLDLIFPLEIFDHSRRKQPMPFRYVRGEPRWDLFENKENMQKQYKENLEKRKKKLRQKGQTDENL